MATARQTGLVKGLGLIDSTTLVMGSMITESDRSWANLMRQEARGRMAHPSRTFPRL